MPIASTDDQLALQASIREWAKRTGTIDVVRGLEPSAGRDGVATTAGTGPAAERWASLAELGVFAIGMPAAAGGAGGSVAELAAVLAQATESLVPGPVLPTEIAGLVLSRCQDQAAAQLAMRALTAGELSIAVALNAGVLTCSPKPDGSLSLHGQLGQVLGGGGTTHLLVSATDPDPADSDPGGGAVWCLLPVAQPGMTLAECAPADFSRPLADISMSGVVAGPDQILAGIRTDQVRDLAATLFAVEAAAVASWCARTAAEYAAIRHQFGLPIGSFQAVKHMCASMLCRAETAAVLAWDAARAADGAAGGLPIAAAAAAAVNLDAAVDTAKDCIQVLGGIGFSWEHDAHLYLRRAVALRQLLGGSAPWRDRTARLALSGVRRQLRLEDAGTSDELAAVRRATAELAAGIATQPPDAQRRVLADSGYAAPAWPPPYGLAASPSAQLVIDDELGQAAIIRPDIVIGGWAIPAILGHGTQEQADRFAAATLRGVITWCQLFSEPEAGL